MKHAIKQTLKGNQFGFALVTELMFLIIFGLGVLALSALTEKTPSENSEAVEKVHAVWLENSPRSRLQMNPEATKSMDYTQNGVDCDTPRKLVQLKL